MAHSKTLQQQVDELRGELAALQAERAREASPAASARPASESAPEPEPETEELPDDGEASASATIGSATIESLGDLEKAFSGVLELTENEIAEHPALAAGLAFLAGIAVGRMSKG